MRRILSACLMATIVLAISPPVGGHDAPLDADPVPTAPVREESPLPQTESAADGTTSVVVPPPVSPPPELTSPPVPPPPVPLAPAIAPPAQEPPAAPPTTLPPSQPSEAPAAPPNEVPPPPPPSETAVVLEALLVPFKSRLASVGGSLDPQLYARPLPLLEPLARSGDRSRRLWIVQAYWKASAAYAIVNSSAEALERLELVAPGSDPHDRATLDVATAAARADLADARARLGAAQQELVDLARLPFGEPLPWPIDRPLTDPYQTHFEAIFANRIATGRVRTIVRSLPPRHEALASRAVAVKAATKAAEMAEADHAQGKRLIESVIAAHTTLVTQHVAFVETVRTYNVEIAEYAMAVADLAVPDEQFVAMLIASPVPWRPQPIEPVSALTYPAPPGVSPPAVAFPPQVTGLPIE